MEYTYDNQISNIWIWRDWFNNLATTIFLKFSFSLN